MDHAIENNVPPHTDSDEDYGPGPDDGIHDPGDYKLRRTGLPLHTDAAHRDPAAGTGLRLGGDAAREIAALRKQVQECEDHNTELQGVVAAVRQAAAAGQQGAKTRYAQTGNPDWLLRGQVWDEVWALVKPIS